MENLYVKLKFINLPRINYAVITKFSSVNKEKLNNSYNELRYVESGSVNYKLNGETYVLKAGEYALFPANCEYTICNGGPSVVISIGFFMDEGYVRLIGENDIVFSRLNNVEFVENEALYFPFKNMLIPNGLPYKTLKKLMRIYDNMEEYNNINVSCELITFFVSLANYSLTSIKNEDAISINAEKYCNKIDQYIEANYSHVITMNIISRYIGLHENYISMIYKNLRGMTVMAKLTKYRMEKAKELLMKKKYTVKEVGEKVGYKSDKYFNTVFKKYENISPGKYVKQFSDDKVYSYWTIYD